jgi:biopolymer transport protein ExbD
MGAVDVGGAKPAGGAGAPGWKRPRVSIRIDMTPMVDIAFLLLIFFMVTTVFRLPQAMEMALPENDPNKPPVTMKVYEKKLLTVMVAHIGERDSLAFMVGTETPRPLAWDSLRTKLLERREIYGDSLTVLAKIDRKASYEAMVDLVDEFNVAKTTRFTLDRYTTVDDSLLRASGIQTMGPEGLPEPAFEVEERE